MTTDERTHLPTTEFRDHLEWELVRAFRHETRMHDQRRRRMLRLMRTAAVVVVSVAIGATASLAPAQIRESARRDSLLESARADAQVIALRLELARDNLADVKRKVDAGVLGAPSLANAETELRAIEARAMRQRYDIQEITATSQAPRDDLNAPLVSGRDYVKERLQLDAVAAQQRLVAAEATFAEADRRVRVGAGPELARLDASNDLEGARAALGVVAKKLALRKEFLEKGTPIEQLQRQLDVTATRYEAYAAQQQLEVARQRLALLQKQQQAGVASDLEVMKAHVDVKELELKLQKLAQRLRAGARAASDR